MGEIDIHEVRREEIGPYIRLRNEIFTGGPVTAEWWRSLYEAEPRAMTGITALRDGEVLSSVSYLLRPFVVGAGAVRTAFANAVGVSEKARGTGVGSLVHAAALEVLPAYADSLKVIISERQKAYHYYVRNGFVALAVPVTYTWRFERSAGVPESQGAEVGEGFDLYRANEAELLDIYRSRGAAQAGCYVHEPGWLTPTRGFHDRNDDSNNGRALRTVIVRDGKGGIRSYALVLALRKQGTPGQVLEAACRGGEPRWAEIALYASAREAAKAGAEGLVIWGGSGHPLDAVFRSLPGVEASRGLGIYGQPLNAQAVADAAYGDSLNRAGLAVRATYEDGDERGEIRVGSGGEELVLAMSRADWVRFVYRRLDVVSGVRQDAVSVICGGPVLERFAAAAGAVPWAYEGISYT
ncbi:MAG: GNAT family N-acetyltransferase [Planctomycetes bacterium]|nr:GNAT family N-acetyltransferase [Planctomycetota bacterium]